MKYTSVKGCGTIGIKANVISTSELDRIVKTYKLLRVQSELVSVGWEFYEMTSETPYSKKSSQARRLASLIGNEMKRLESSLVKS